MFPTRDSKCPGTGYDGVHMPTSSSTRGRYQRDQDTESVESHSRDRLLPYQVQTQNVDSKETKRSKLALALGLVHQNRTVPFPDPGMNAARTLFESTWNLVNTVG